MEKLRIFFENYEDVIINLSATSILLFLSIFLLIAIIILIKDFLL